MHQGDQMLQEWTTNIHCCGWLFSVFSQQRAAMLCSCWCSRRVGMPKFCAGDTVCRIRMCLAQTPFAHFCEGNNQIADDRSIKHYIIIYSYIVFNILNACLHFSQCQFPLHPISNPDLLHLLRHRLLWNAFYCILRHLWMLGGRNQNELWVMLLEKAWATWQTLQGQLGQVVLSHLAVGRYPTFIHFRTKSLKGGSCLWWVVRMHTPE